MRMVYRLLAGCLIAIILCLPETAAHADVYGYAGWATYYGIEDGFVKGDVMYDGNTYDPADPSIAAASNIFPIHTWLRVCSSSNCIAVEVQDRGLLDENGILLDLSRAAYQRLFGSLGGKQWIDAYYSGSTAPIQGGGWGISSQDQIAAPPPAAIPSSDKMQW